MEVEHHRLFDSLGKRYCWRRGAKLSRFQEISSSAFETLGAPRVGFDPRADAWAVEQHAKQKEPIPIEQWLEKLYGLYVVALVPPCDGLPRYTNGSVAGYLEPFSFRAQFLTDCASIIGQARLDAAYRHQLPAEALSFGRTLVAVAQDYAREHGIDVSSRPGDDDAESDAFRVDVVLSAGRWCVFWADRRHPLEAYW